MKDIKFLNTLSQAANKVGFQIKKSSPSILVGAGVVGVVTSTVLACKATPKAITIVNEAKDQVSKVHQCLENQELIESGKYSVEDSKKDLTIIYTKTGVELIKAYAPSVLLGVLSITSIVASHKILTKRNMAISSAYMVVDKSFKDYRKRVEERFGKEVEREIKHNIKSEKITTTSTDEKGKEKKETKTVEYIDPEGNKYSLHSRFFDETCPDWTKDPEYNLMFLRQQEQWANDKLRAQGHLFLNEVYDALGIPRTKEGAVVGWISKVDPELGNDGYVDFGIYDINKRGSREFVNGFERSILLDFNVDGIIYDLLK